MEIEVKEMKIKCLFTSCMDLQSTKTSSNQPKWTSEAS